jgi:hypothetical protein
MALSIAKASPLATPSKRGYLADKTANPLPDRTWLAFRHLKRDNSVSGAAFSAALPAWQLRAAVK